MQEIKEATSQVGFSQKMATILHHHEKVWTLELRESGGSTN